MVKATAASSGPGIYSGTYSGIPVYEYQFGEDLKEHVMRRRHDDWVNATHILKAAGFDKPARTRILERDVQKALHEKIQGGYGKYQGTWIPLDSAESLARRHSVYDRVRLIFDYVPGDESPPPAPRHAIKPKAFKPKPDQANMPKAAPHKRVAAAKLQSVTPRAQPAPSLVSDDHDMAEAIADDETPDNLTVASGPGVDQDDRLEICNSNAHKKRKREEELQMTEQQHSLYGDELLDYFLLSQNEQCAVRPDPPANFIPNFTIDSEDHTALHWAAAMGDTDVIRQLKRLNASMTARNIRGETPLMRAVNFTNCYEKHTFPHVFKELFETFDCRDAVGFSVLHHAATARAGRLDGPASCEYYLDVILNRLQEALEPNILQQFIDAQDNSGNTALHIAAQSAAQGNARKCIRALLGRNASTHIANNQGVCVEELIRDINVSKTRQPGVQPPSSSPFVPDVPRQASFRNGITNGNNGADSLRVKPAASFRSIAATTIGSRVAPILLEKLQDLAKTYDEEWQEKESAETEAQRLLANTQADLATAHRHMADIEANLEPEDVASKTLNEANLAKHQVLSLIEHQNRQLVQHHVDSQLQELVDAEISRSVGDSDHQSDDEIGYDAHLALARDLHRVLGEQRQQESDYVEALSLVGVGDRIDRYRHLLRLCLDTKDSESLDGNLDTLIEMMEEECDSEDGPVNLKQAAKPMDLALGTKR